MRTYNREYFKQFVESNETTIKKLSNKLYEYTIDNETYIIELGTTKGLTLVYATGHLVVNKGLVSTFSNRLSDIDESMVKVFMDKWVTQEGKLEWLRNAYSKANIHSEPKITILGKNYDVNFKKSTSTRVSIDYDKNVVNITGNNKRSIMNLFGDEIYNKLTPIIDSIVDKYKSDFRTIDYSKTDIFFNSRASTTIAYYQKYHKKLNFNLYMLYGFSLQLLNEITYHEMLHSVYNDHKKPFRDAMKSKFPNLAKQKSFTTVSEHDEKFTIDEVLDRLLVAGK